MPNANPNKRTASDRRANPANDKAAKSGRCPPELDPERRKRVTGSSDPMVAHHRLQFLFKTIPLPPWLTQDEVDTIKRNVFEMIEDLDPRDEVERQIINHFVLVHFSTMEAHRHAWHASETAELRDMYLGHGVKLADLHLKLVAALDKHRRGGGQVVKVEHTHINVNNGQQTIVRDGKDEIPEADYKEVEPEQPPCQVDQEVLPPDPFEGVRPMKRVRARRKDGGDGA